MNTLHSLGRLAPALVLAIALALPEQRASAQSQTTGQTKCRTEFGQVVCDTESQTTPSRGSCGGICAAIALRTGYLEGQKERAAKEEQVRSEDLQIRRLRAEADQINANRNAAIAERDATVARTQAQRALFDDKASAVVKQVADSSKLPLYEGHRTLEALATELDGRLALVWTANHNASNTDIFEAVSPIFVRYRQRSEAFRERFLRSLSSASKELRIREGSAPHDTLWHALASRAILVAADNLDAPSDTIDAVLRPLVDSAFAARMSARAKTVLRSKHPD
jgi:hypothetical protein